MTGGLSDFFERNSSYMHYAYLENLKISYLSDASREKFP